MSLERPPPRSILDEVSEYLGFGAEDATLLMGAAPHVRPAFPEIIDAFYVAIDQNPGARQVFAGQAQLERLKVQLAGWLEGLFCGVYDDAYLARRSRIGRVHVQIGLGQRYMFGAMGVLRRGLKGALARAELTDEVVAKTGAAIDRICDIELAIMLESYREAYTRGLRAERSALAHDLQASETERAELMRTAGRHEALATIGTLTAGLAHEVRNPLNAAKLQLELIARGAGKLEDVDRSTRIRERVGLVNTELSRLSEMLDDFLALARQRHIEPKPVALGPLLAEVVELEGPVAAASGISLVVGQCRGISVLADRSKIHQVLINLVANAVDAMRGSGGHIRISAQAADEKGARVQIEVSDSGPGISPEVAANLFEPFVTTREAGTGLGLSIVKRIVESHGGELVVASTGPKGTTMRFTLGRA